MDPNTNTGQGNTIPGAVPPRPPEANFGMPPMQQPSAGENMPADATAPAMPPMLSSAPPPAANGWLPPTVPLQAPTGSDDTAAAQQSGQPGVTAPGDADDADLIEKEWVIRAKQIVEGTRQDPYRQTKEMHKFKAEYMKKRYNKTIETVED